MTWLFMAATLVNETIPGLSAYSDNVLLFRFLTYCPSKRISASNALKHDWFSETPLPVDPSMFPTWPAKSEQPRVKKVVDSPKAPQGGKEYNNLLVSYCRCSPPSLSLSFLVQLESSTAYMLVQRSTTYGPRVELFFC